PQWVRSRNGAAGAAVEPDPGAGLRGYPGRLLSSSGARRPLEEARLQSGQKPRWAKKVRPGRKRAHPPEPCILESTEGFPDSLLVDPGPPRPTFARENQTVG